MGARIRRGRWEGGGREMCGKGECNALGDKLQRKILVRDY